MHRKSIKDDVKNVRKLASSARLSWEVGLLPVLGPPKLERYS